MNKRLIHNEYRRLTTAKSSCPPCPRMIHPHPSPVDFVVSFCRKARIFTPAPLTLGPATALTLATKKLVM